MQVRCCARILTLIVYKGLKELDASIFRTCTEVKRSSQARLLSFKSIIKAESIEEKSLVCNVDTRQKSTFFLMLKSTLKFQRASSMMEIKIRSNEHNFLSQMHCPMRKIEIMQLLSCPSWSSFITLSSVYQVRHMLLIMFIW